MDEPQKHAQWKKPVRKGHKLYDLCEMSSRDRLIYNKKGKLVIA